MLAKTKKFIAECRSELLKVTWPWDPKEKGFKRYKELVDSTLMVVVASLLLAAYIASTDFVVVHVVGFLTSF